MICGKMIKLINEAKNRMQAINFGDEITNVICGNNQPQRYSYFVKTHVTYKPTIKPLQKYKYRVVCTDRKGQFWDADILFIYPGRVAYEDCEKINKKYLLQAILAYNQN